MIHIITTTQLQQQIGQLSAFIDEKTFIVTNRGEGRIVMLPYFDGCDEKIMEYMEDYEMYKNQKQLKKRYAHAARSGKSSLTI